MGNGTGDFDIFSGFLVILAICFLLAAIVFVLWIALHRVLSKYDDVLLREPFFRKSEQMNALVWPFNYWKTLTYICLFAAPGLSKKKRFKGLDKIPRVSKATIMASKIQFSLMCFCGLMFFVYFGYGAFFLYIYPRLQ
ncbi:hypothetical protein ACXYTJ_06255 [Gilvimarinus sp. F26214L]|uniref:hypothetical protein n=1 Tax=Gilvimarinus sp. DZF01 TaxID=3461371 RepID=UPI0040467C72